MLKPALRLLEMQAQRLAREHSVSANPGQGGLRIRCWLTLFLGSAQAFETLPQLGLVPVRAERERRPVKQKDQTRAPTTVEVRPVVVGDSFAQEALEELALEPAVELVSTPVARPLQKETEAQRWVAQAAAVRIAETLEPNQPVRKLPPSRLAELPPDRSVPR